MRDGEIASVLDRRTAVVRASADPGKGAQVLAANVEFVLVAEPLGERWRPRRLERLLVVAWQSAAIPIVVLTKADRCDDIEAALSLARAVAPGASVYAVSPLYGDGTEELAKALAPGTTAVIIGRSGAGLIDSTEAIGDAFSDLEALAPNCRFGDCAHESEPGCAVQEAISAGELDGERLASYRRLQREQERLEAREDPRLRAAKAAEWRRFSKEIRRLPKH